MVFLKEGVGASMGKASFTRGEPFDKKNAIIQRNHYNEVESLGVCNIFWKKQVMVVCVQYAFNMNETSEQNKQHYFEEVKSVL